MRQGRKLFLGIGLAVVLAVALSVLLLGSTTSAGPGGGVDIVCTICPPSQAGECDVKDCPDGYGVCYIPECFPEDPLCDYHLDGILGGCSVANNTTICHYSCGSI